MVDGQSRESFCITVNEGELGISLTLDVESCLPMIRLPVALKGQVEVSDPGRVRIGDWLDGINGTRFPRISSFDRNNNGIIVKSEICEALNLHPYII